VELVATKFPRLSFPLPLPPGVVPVPFPPGVVPVPFPPGVVPPVPFPPGVVPVPFPPGVVPPVPLPPGLVPVPLPLRAVPVLLVLADEELLPLDSSWLPPKPALFLEVSVVERSLVGLFRAVELFAPNPELVLDSL